MVNLYYSHCIDAEDFDPEAGFSKPQGEGGGEDTWEGEDEGLVIEDDKEEVKSKSKELSVE